MSAARAFLASMAGRIFLVMLFGVMLSASIAWTVANARRQGELQQAGLERAAERVRDFVIDWQAAPPQERARRVAAPSPTGLRFAPADARGLRTDPALTALLHAQLPDNPDARAEHADPGLCLTAAEPARARPIRDRVIPQCWLVSVGGGTASMLRIVLQAPPRPGGNPLLFYPVYLVVLIGLLAVLAFFVARMAAAPLHILSKAASELGGDLARPPMPLRGPTEVREAARTFNAMQKRLQTQLAERTHMLAAITHDLQTPITRLRLRLEKVADEDLRERLLGDLAAMQALVRDGLELARTEVGAERPVLVDLGSLLTSLVEDAADAGQDVRLVESVSADVRAQPKALQRCFSNLIGNALRYGGSAEIVARREDGLLTVRIRDHGPGLPSDQLESVFEPFVRIETSRSRDTGGAGLGLAIARTLAEKNGATVSLRNHPEGGAEAIVVFGALERRPEP